MKHRILIATCIAVCSVALLSFPVEAQWTAPDKQKPSDPSEIKKALTGGVPGGRWKEGLMFEGIEPMPWLVSAANWFPNTEDVKPNEMRIHFMGTSPLIRPGQCAQTLEARSGVPTTRAPPQKLS